VRGLAIVFGLAWLLAVGPTPAQTQDAGAVLAAMRAALGGESVLDTVRTFSVSGSLNETSGSFTKSFSVELLAMLPDHFLTIRRDFQSSGPLQIDITYYGGFRGAEVIRHTESNIPFPPDPGPQTPEAIAKRREGLLLKRQREFARLVLLLFGKSVASYPLQFSGAGRETVETVGGRSVDVIDARAADDHVMRLHIDAATHLPVFVAWQDAEPVVFTTSLSSQVTTRGGQVVSQAPPAGAPPVPDLASLSPRFVTWKVVPTDFRNQNGVNWPRRIQVVIDDKVNEDMRLGSFRLNPKIDPRRFNIGK
jgi:hypothetical protein